MERRYEDEVLMPELVRRRKRLRELQALKGSEASREMFKGLAKHEAAYTRRLREDKHDFQKRAKVRAKEFAKRVPPRRYQRDRYKDARAQREEEERERRGMLVERKKYSELVRYMYKPGIDRDKQRELSDRVKRLEAKKRQIQEKMEAGRPPPLPKRAGRGTGRDGVGPMGEAQIRAKRERERRERELARRQREQAKRRRRNEARAAERERQRQAEEEKRRQALSTVKHDYDIDKLGNMTDTYIDVMKGKMALVRQQMESFKQDESAWDREASGGIGEDGSGRLGGARPSGQPNETGRRRGKGLPSFARANRFRGPVEVEGETVQVNARQLGAKIIISASDGKSRERYTLEKTLPSAKGLDKSQLRAQIVEMLSDRMMLAREGDDAF
jgi:hypothetical protein